MTSKLYNFTDYPLTINKESIDKIIIKPKEYDYIDPSIGFSIYSFDPDRKIHKFDAVLPNKIEKGNSIAVGQLIYEEIHFNDNLAYECDELIGMSYLIPNYLDQYYNNIMLIIYLLIAFVAGVLLFILNRNLLIGKG